MPTSASVADIGWAHLTISVLRVDRVGHTCVEFAPFERRAETSWDNDPEPGKRTLAAMRAGVQHLEVLHRG